MAVERIYQYLQKQNLKQVAILTVSTGFGVAGMEQLKMPYGNLEALRLVRQEEKQYDQRVELWMAPSLEHLPVRIRITQTSGDQVDLLLRSKAPPSASP